MRLDLGEVMHVFYWDSIVTPEIYIIGIGLKGPGLPNWPTAQATLIHGGFESLRETPPGVASLLPPTERRRATRVTRLALDVAQEAIGNHDPSSIAALFTSSGGEVGIVHEIFNTLAGPDRRLSPTAFHNSVHNAAAGYWSIASGSRMPSDSLCAYDDSFGSGLLEGLLRLQEPNDRILLVAYDVPAPYPISAHRSMTSAFAVSLLLSRDPKDQAMASINWSYRPDSARVLGLNDPGLEALRSTNPAARALPLLEVIANQVVQTLFVGVGMQGSLCLEVRPCY